MYLVVIAWLYVVLMMAVAEATGNQGSVLGALITVVLYGVLPLAIVMYLMGTPGRRRARRAAEARTQATMDSRPAEALDPDDGRHAPGDAVAAKREET